MNDHGVIRAFSPDHVIKLTGLTKSQLYYWDSTGFFQPYYGHEERKSPHSRVYSFRNVVRLKTIALLRNKHKVSLQHLRRVGEKLSHLEEALWSNVKLYVVGRGVHFQEPETGHVRGVLSGQYTMIPLSHVIEDVAEAAKQLTQRTRQQFGRVERNRYVAHNAWVIAGTRISTRTIARFNKEGYSTADILKEYSSLRREDIEAALEHEQGQVKKSA